MSENICPPRKSSLEFPRLSTVVESLKTSPGAKKFFDKAKGFFEKHKWGEDFFRGKKS